MKAYENASRAYAQAVLELSRAVGAMATAEYELVRNKTAAARERCQHTRDQLATHTREHNC